MKYFKFRGSKKKNIIFPTSENHKWVAYSANCDYETFDTREEARGFCKYQNEILKVDYHYKVYKIREE